MSEEQTFRVITDLRKAGKLSEAWEVGSAEVKKDPNNSYLKGAFFWVCYDYIKQVQESIKDRAVVNNGNYKPNQGELDRINYLMDCIIWLNIPAGGFEYRSLLLVFQKNMECIPKLVLLLVKHRDSLFEKDDKSPYLGEKGESPSLMLNFARKVAKAWMLYEEVKQINIDQLLLIFNQTRKEIEDKDNLIWLDYDEAKCLIIAGRTEQARDFVVPVLRKKQTESWAWGALAATYRGQDNDVAIILLAQGLCHVHDEKFALPLLKGIAPLLASKGFVKEASMCVVRAKNCYLNSGWAIKQDLEKLIHQTWFDSDVNIDVLGDFLQEKSQGALDYLYGATEECVAVVMNVHQSGKGFHVYRDQKHRYSVRLGLFRSKKIPKAGEYVRLKISAEDDVIAAESCAAEEMKDLGYIEGCIRITHKGFGFVDDTFVPASLVVNGIDGQSVKVLRILDFDKAKNKLGWKALAVEVI